MRWDDPSLRVSSDPSRRARYRRLQSWYRATVLGVEPGRDRNGRAIGSLLPADAVRADPTLNFLRDPELWGVAEQRLRQNEGTFVKGRLMHNLLSSQPLCINLFGKLGLHPIEGAAVLAQAFGLPIAALELVAIEHAPAAATAVLDDRTAFDAYLEYRTPDGERRFLGIETKYTEPFSNDLGLSEEKREKYRRIAQDLGVFTEPLRPDLTKPAASQLFRNLLLGMTHQRLEGITGHVVVVALRGDRAAAKGVDVVRTSLDTPDAHLLSVSIDDLISASKASPTLAGWAIEFERRYLDLSPLTEPG